jgi:uncharacterized protein
MVTSAPKGAVVLAGGSGFVGRRLIDEFADAGYPVVVLSRSPQNLPRAEVAAWDGRTLGSWQERLEGSAAVINLAGSSIAQRWTEKAKREIIASRVESARVIGEAIQKCSQPPPVWVNSSATGIYGDRNAEELDEASEIGPRGHFLVDTGVAWEHAVDAADVSARRVKLRTGLAMDRGGGVFQPLHTLTRFFLGGHAGSGEQYMSWIHMDDLARAYRFCVEENISGVVNATAPHPATNRFFMATLRAVVGRPWAPPAPAFLLRLVEMVGGPPASLLLEGQRVLPGRLHESGFRFTFPDLRDALKDLVQNR